MDSIHNLRPECLPLDLPRQLTQGFLHHISEKIAKAPILKK